MKKTTKILLGFTALWLIVFAILYLLKIYAQGNIDRYNNESPKYTIHIKNLVIGRDILVALQTGSVPMLLTDRLHTNIFNDTLFVIKNNYSMPNQSAFAIYTADLPELQYVKMSANGKLDAINFNLASLNLLMKDSSICQIKNIKEITAIIKGDARGYFAVEKANIKLADSGFCELRMTNGELSGEISGDSQLSIIGSVNMDKFKNSGKGQIFLNGKKIK